MPPTRYHSDTEWRAQLNLIARLYLDEGLSYEEIAKQLEAVNFSTSWSSVKAKLQSWRIHKNTDDNELMARRFLFQQARGTTVSFRRCGIDVHASTIRSFIEQNPVRASQDVLPEHIQEVFSDSVHSTANTVGEPNGSDQPLATDAALHAGPSLPTDISDDQRRNKKRKLPLRPPTANYHQNSDNTNETSNDARHVSNDNSNDESDTKRTASSKSQSQTSKEEEVKKAFAMLQQISQQDTQANEAVKHAEEVLTAALKNDSNLPSEKDRTDMGPLHSAALKGDQKTSALLLRFGADINARGGFGTTALHCAAARGHHVLVKFLLEQPGIDIDAIHSLGSPALHVALSKPWRHVALLLLQHGANVDICDDNQRSALHLACMEPGLLPHVEEIIARTKKLNHRDHRGQTPLHLALGFDNDEYIAPLLAAGANLNIKDEDGRTPMMQASFDAPPELLTLLLDQNPDLSLKANKGETALHILCQRELYDIIQRVVDDFEVDINARSSSGITPLMIAVTKGYEKTVRLLVEKKVDLKARDINSDTALCMAIDNGFLKIAEFLIESGSPVNPLGQSTVKWKTQLENEHKIEQELLVLSTQPTHKVRMPQQARFTNMTFAPQYGSTSLQQAIQFHAQALNDLTSKSANAGNAQRDAATHQNVVMDPQLAFNAMNAPTQNHLPFTGNSPLFFGPGSEFDLMGGIQTTF